MLLAPAFLLGLLAIGLPLWLHRFARQTQDRRPFASLMLLEASEQHRSHRHTLRYLLLLALRIGLLIAIVLAFSEPVLRAAASVIGGRGSTLNVVVLDTSHSMQFGERWERAIERAREVINSVGSGDRIMLVAADHRVRIIHEPVDGGAKQAVLGALGSVRPGLTRLDYGMLMTSSQSWIDTPGTAARLHLITDLQQTASPLRFADLGPPPGVQLNLIDTGDDEASNAFIQRVALSPRDLDVLDVRIAGTPPAGANEAGEAAGAGGAVATDRTGTESEAAATGGTAKGEKRSVVLSIDGQERARRAVALNEQGRQRVLFSGLGLEAGTHRAVVSLEPRDELPQDDEFHATLERVDPRVLLVSADTEADDASYLAAAIGSLTSPRLAVERVTPAGVMERTLASYAAVVVSDAGILSADPAEALRQYLESGGAVLMTLGPRAAAAETIPLSGHRTEGASVSAQSAAQAARVSVVEESHPVLREAQGWRSIRFFRYVPIEPGDGDTVLIRFEEGPPLLLEQRTGGGRLLVLTSPLARDWNDLAIHPVFVRFIGEAARYLTDISGGGVSAVVGTPFSASLKGRAGAQIFDPQGRRVLSLGESAATMRLLPEQPGFYEVRGSGRTDWIAVNVDPREADLGRMPPESIRRWQALRAPAQQPDVRAGGTTDAAAPVVPVWFWVLMVAAALAFLEPLVANYHLNVRREVQS